MKHDRRNRRYLVSIPLQGLVASGLITTGNTSCGYKLVSIPLQGLVASGLTLDIDTKEAGLLVSIPLQGLVASGLAARKRKVTNLPKFQSLSRD